MKALLASVVFSAVVAHAGVAIERPWGWAVTTAEGTTHVVRQWDGYAVSGPRANVRLVRRNDGYAITPQPGRARVVPPDALFDGYYAGKRRR